MRKNTNYKSSFYNCIVTVAAFMVFTVLKLTGVIAWSWWWVTAPIWIPFVLAMIVVILVLYIISGYDKFKI